MSKHTNFYDLFNSANLQYYLLQNLIKNKPINVKVNEIAIIQFDINDYISLTDILKWEDLDF